MVAAVALFTAVSCNKEIEQDNLPAGETVVYTASTDAQTKAALNETTKKSEWVANDAITVHDGTKGWTFTTAGSGANADFVNSEGFGDYRPVMAVYPAGEWSADVNTKTVSAAIPADQQAQIGTYHSPAALAVAYSENNSFAFRNAHALLKFTVNADNVTHVIFHGNEEEKITGKVSVELGDEGVSVTGMDMTYAKCYAWHDADNKYFLKGEGNTYYMAVAPQTFNKGVTVKIQVNEGAEIVVKTTEKPVETKANTILDLGELTYEVPVAEWAIAGTFNEWSPTATPMTLEGEYYVARKVSGLNFTANSDPENKSSDTGIKFVNNGTVWKGGYGDTDTPGKLSVNSWSWYWEDGGVNVYVDGASAETEYDIYLNPSNGKFVIVAAGAAMPEDKPEQPETDASAYGLVGSFQGWDVASPIAMTNSEGGWIVAENVELYKDDELKFVKDKSWDVSYGTSSVTVIEEGQEFTVQTENGQNMKVAKNGKFNLYFNPTTLNVKVECIDEYTDLTVNITIDNKANWSPLYIYIESDGKAVTPAEGVLVSDNTYAVSGDYIGSTLTCKLISGSKVSEAMNVTVTKNGATVTLEETIIKLKVQLDTDNSKQWWGNNMKIHVWNTSASFDTSWPGTAMTSEGNYTWSIIVPSELVGKTINYLVHNGNGWQSSDATVTIAAEGNIVKGSSIGIN